jgi:hypothetical protein
LKLKSSLPSRAIRARADQLVLKAKLASLAGAGDTAIGKLSEAIRVVSTVMRRASTCAAS